METWIETINQLTGGPARGGVGALSSATTSILNSLYPKEFELYMLSLELTTFDDTPIDYLTFPVNPDSLTKVEPKIKDISRSYGAVIVTKTDTFVPQDLVIRGNFGKSFKFLSRENSAVAGIVNMFKGMVPSFKGGELSKYWKSGYGCLKVLQSIVQDSDKMDNGRPRRLYLHNFMLGESYLVEVLNFQMDNNVQRNMIWEYELRLKILTPINVSTGERIKSGLSNQVQNLGNSIARGTKNILLGLIPV